LILNSKVTMLKFAMSINAIEGEHPYYVKAV
jgi:hypothetical protein